MRRLLSSLANNLTDPLQKSSHFESLVRSQNTLLSLKNVFKYGKMTPVQEAVLKASSSNDLLVRAKTGTGKTLAFLIKAMEIGGPVVVISPTRELAMQIANEAQKLAVYHRTSVITAVGGTSRNHLIRALKMNKPGIIVGTPGRMMDIIDNAPEIKKHIENLKVLIYDEADQLLDMGFKRDIEAITESLPKDRSTFMFSATISPEIRKIAANVLGDHFEDIDTVDEKDEDTVLSIKQSYLTVPLKTQIGVLYDIIQKHRNSHIKPKIMVFFQTTLATKLFSRIFKQMGVDCLEIHSGLEQKQRSNVSNCFRSATSAILFTSDVSARGVDYPNVSLVISFGAPSSREMYVHRIGRTGRAGKEGEAILILNPHEQQFMNHVSDLPIREDVRFNPLSVDDQLKEKIELALYRQEPEKVEATARAIAAYRNFVLI
jgi:ATP-dependent RNA helicase MSS116